MPRRKAGSFPTLRHHKPSGLAVVTLSGQDFYCGNYGTKASLAEYDRVVAEWLARGRRPQQPTEGVETTIVELISAYHRHAKLYYRKNGKVTNEVSAWKSAAKVVRQLYGREPANEFGPLKLQAVQQAMIRLDWNRRHINKQISRVVRMFAWGVSQELVNADLVRALREVPGLHKGRTKARESAPVLPVDDSVVNATLENLSPIVADMIRFQRLTGCRPEDVCSIRPCNVETSGDVWTYTPESHKTEHLGRSRIICIGPRAQTILRAYLLREKTSYCFSPADSERNRRADQHAQRRTPLSCGNRPGINKSRNPKRPAGAYYTTASYRRAIHRACDRAFPPPPPLAQNTDETAKQWKVRLTSRQTAKLKAWQKEHRWSPNQLRHTAATDIRRQYGLEAAQVTLGHASADVTQIYAERDLAKAREIMREVG